MLACSDRSIRILSADKKVMFEVATPSPPTALLYTPDSHDPLRKFPAAAKQVLYGCEDGRVVQLMVDSGAVRQGFTITPPAGAGAVRCLYSGADYSKVRGVGSRGNEFVFPVVCHSKGAIGPASQTVAKTGRWSICGLCLVCSQGTGYREDVMVR